MTLFQILSSTGLPVSEVSFPENSGVEPPFILYETARQNNFKADNKTYKPVDIIQIRLVDSGRRPDKTNIAALESALTTNEIPFELATAFYVETENTYESIYEIGVMR